MLSASVARQALHVIPPHVREISAMEHSMHVPGPSARHVHMAPTRPRGGYTAARFPFRNHNLHFPSPHALLSSPHAAMPKILVKEPAPSPAASKSCTSSSSSDTSSSSSLLFGGPRGARITEEVARPRRKATRGTGGRGSSRPSQGVVYAAYEIDDVPHLSDSIPNLPTYINPLKHNPAYRYVEKSFVEDDDVVMQYSLTKINNDSKPVPCYRRSGPREKIYFDPEDVRVAIVTCGGLCPGLNTVIRELVWGLWFQYGVRSIQGIDGGYRGFYSRNWIDLDPRTVEDIHKRGGTSLGTSRGGHDPAKIVSAIEDRGINQVYIIGGDGTQRGALVIYEECMRRGLKVAVAGIPKTIDNDIPIIDKSFGFDTAVEEAQRAIMAAHVEAESTHRGVGIVKLMGRYCGQIAMHATLASRDVDCCLIPEVPFHLEGEGGLLRFIEHRLRENDHAVIVVAEGAGQELMERDRDLQRNRVRRDQSGNKLLNDVGLWLSNQIKNHFEEQKLEINLKYIDPTYMIRAIPANASDNIYCTLLAHSAIHGAMAGYTGFTVGPVNGRHCLIPIEKITQFTNNISLTDRMWARLLASTSQPTFLRIASSPAATSEIKANGTATATALMPAALAAPVMATSMAAVASASTATSAAASQLADLMAAADSSAWERFDGEELAGVPEEDDGLWKEADEQRAGSQT